VTYENILSNVFSSFNSKYCLMPMYSAKMPLFPAVGVNLNRVWPLKHHFIEYYQLIKYV